MITLETARTTLRPLTTGDLPDVQRWASVPENVKYMDWGPNSDEQTTVFLEGCEKNWAAEPVRNYDFGIVLKETGELIGACKVYIMDTLSAGELGWILRRDYWQRGLATEAAGALIRFSFETLRLHRVFAVCYAENTGSYKIMEHFNMRREGLYIKSKRLRHAVPETWCDVYNYALMEEEYFRQRT